MEIREILRRKGHEVVTTSGAESVIDAVRLLVEHNIGGVVVVDGERVTGILTERDILRLTARVPGELETLSVESAMTTDVITVRPDDKLDRVMDIMTQHRIRHVPVIEGGKLGGIVTIGDVVNACRRIAEEENVHMREYIQGGEA